MGLVDYSDSEGSESEQGPPQATSANPPTSKTGFQAVVDKSNPRKIKVDLPSSSGTSKPEAVDASDQNGPPAKRPRTGAFGGFNSFLPAPKNVGKPSNGTTAGEGGSRPRSMGLGRGVSLRTGAAPAFSRDAPPEEWYEENIEDEADPGYPRASAAADQPSMAMDSTDNDGVSSTAQINTQQPKRAMFRPLSVARKPEKKKKKYPAAPPTTETNGNFATQSATTSISRKDNALSPKKSLFSSVEEEETKAEPESTTTDQYQPFFAEDAAPQEDDALSEQPQPTQPGPNVPNDLTALASSLDLTPAQRRQLFGRHGAPTAAQVSQFSVSQEYSHNQAMLAAGEANTSAAPKTVRSIAPGKHSLQQLLNQANSQKDALEESFQRGKANRKDAGSRYGW